MKKIFYLFVMSFVFFTFCSNPIHVENEDVKPIPDNVALLFKKHNINSTRIIGDVMFIAKHSKKAISVRGSSKSDRAKLIQWKRHGGDNQRFLIVDAGDGFVYLFAKHSGKVLDIEHGSTNPGAKVIQYRYHGGENQQFKLIHRKKNLFSIQARHSALVLDVYGGSIDNGAAIIQWPYKKGSKNQLFKLIDPNN